MPFPTCASDDAKLLAWRKTRGCGQDTGVEHDSDFFRSFFNTRWGLRPAAASVRGQHLQQSSCIGRVYLNRVLAPGKHDDGMMHMELLHGR